MMAAAAGALALALVAGPCVAVTETSRRRPFGALADFSAFCAAGAALIAAAATVVEIGVLLRYPTTRIAFAGLAPPSIAVATWAAGELCAGPSPRQGLSLAAAMVAAYLAVLLLQIVSGSLVMGACSTAVAATAAYLCTRGEST